MTTSTISQHNNNNTMLKYCMNKLQTSNHDIPDLPLDIILNIIAKLPVKSIVACMLLSKPLYHLISSPSFTHIYQTNKPNSSFTAVTLVGSKPHCLMELLEFDQNDVCKEEGAHKISKVEVFNTAKLLGLSSSECKAYPTWGYSNGLFCISKLENGFFNLFVTNPILGQIIVLPDPKYNKNKFFAYGIGYSELRRTHKVLRIVTEYLGDGKYKNHAEIFTIGVDQSWRSLEDVNVPHNLIWGYNTLKPQTVMVSFRSALHWVVRPTVTLEPKFGGARMCICAFDITEENVNAIQLPQEVASASRLIGWFYVLCDKLCLWELPEDVNSIVLWVMDDYGVEASWTKKVKLQNWAQPSCVDFFNLFPLTVSPEGVIALSDLKNLVFYDMEKKKYLTVIHQSDDMTYTVPFVPSFVSLRDLVQGPRLIDIQPSSRESEVQVTGWTRITMALKTRWSAILNYLAATLMDQDDQGSENYS